MTSFNNERVNFLILENFCPCNNLKKSFGYLYNFLFFYMHLDIFDFKICSLNLFEI